MFEIPLNTINYGLKRKNTTPTTEQIRSWANISKFTLMGTFHMDGKLTGSCSATAASDSVQAQFWP